MPSMFFGQYLLAKGVISGDALLDAIQRRRAANLSVPELAVRRGYLEQGKAEQALTLFRMSERTIEDICLVEGYLSSDQLEELLVIKKREHRRIGDCLVEGGHLGREQVDNLHEEFRANERLEMQQLEADLEGFSDRKIIRTALDLTVFHFQRISNRVVKLYSISSSDGELRENRVRYGQRIVGDQVFTLAIDLPDSLANLVAKGLLGIETELGPEVTKDAVCEFVNVVGGNACTHLESAGSSMRPEPPFMCGPGKQVTPDGRSVRALLLSEEDQFEIQVFV